MGLDYAQETELSNEREWTQVGEALLKDLID